MEDKDNKPKETEKNPLHDENGKFVKGNDGGGGGRPIETEEKKLKRKAQKKLIKNYIAGLTKALEDIEPVLIKKAVGGDLVAIKEVNDRTMGKAQQNIDHTSKGKEIQPLGGFNYVKPRTDNPDNQTSPEAG